MKYFGTDGICGVIGKEINSKLIRKIAKGIVIYFRHSKQKKVILIGNDSRISSNHILAHLETYLLKYGIQVDFLGICSSPCLAYITKKYNYPLGIMLSASHNPAEFNGFKFFNSNGAKVSDKFEEHFEKLMDNKTNLKLTNFSKRENVEKLKNDYILFLKNLKNFNFPCIFDCANGGTSLIIKHLFPKQEKISFHPNGTNINSNCGCSHLERLKSICIKKQKIGFAFDGDGDKLLVISENGEILNGDKLLFIFSKFFQSQNDSLIGTIYSNLGLEHAMKKRNISLIRSNVGDKNIYKLMLKTKSVVGGEESGHIILKLHSNTSDGVLNAIILGNILQLSKKSLNKLLEDYDEHTQLREDIEIDDAKRTLISSEKFKEKIKKLQTNNSSKIIIRLSETKPLIKIFVEDKNLKNAEILLEKVKNLIKNQ